MQDPLEPFLESSDVARALDMSVSGVRLLVLEGRLMPVARTRRGSRLFSATDVELFKTRRTTRDTASLTQSEAVKKS
jgi:DNA-binding transcriptional MerR regulator